MYKVLAVGVLISFLGFTLLLQTSDLFSIIFSGLLLGFFV